MGADSRRLHLRRPVPAPGGAGAVQVRGARAGDAPTPTRATGLDGVPTCLDRCRAEPLAARPLEQTEARLHDIPTRKEPVAGNQRRWPVIRDEASLAEPPIRAGPELPWHSPVCLAAY